MRLDYDTVDGRGNALPNGQFSYQGFAPPGIGVGDDHWTIYEYSYDTDAPNGIEIRQVAFKVNWTDRATHAYT